ncbi:MAG TPA: phosphatidate cytidylyltransferase [Dehalococcoidia bacterium]|nr:phosphatidate cytidylyltransferase [Dehalococcoidia bacterium]
MLRKRIITALWGLPLLIVAVWFDEPLPWFTVFIAIWGLLAAYEFFRLVGVSGIYSLTVFGLLFTLLVILSPHCTSQFAAPLLVMLAVVLPLIWLVLRQRVEGAFTGWAWMVAGFLYVGWMLSFLVDLRLEAGRNWVFFALFVTFGSDTAAYFIGRVLGKHRLTPQISPHKSWEGAVGGLLGATAVSLLFTLSTPLQITLSIGQGIVLALLVSVFGQIGDLAESLLKRNAGVKESGNSIPGHGGFLDRMDSVVFAGVTVHLYYTLTLL